MDSKHTPGPWTTSLCESGIEILTEDGESVAVVCHYGDPYDSKREEANARLIAAAPELLEALRGLVELSEDRAGGRLTLSEVFGPSEGRGCVLGVDVQIEGLNARTAIAKATGQQTTEAQ